MNATLVIVAALLVGLAPVTATGVEPEIVELVPEDRASWGAAQFFAPVTGLFMGGPGYWYGERTIEVETTPPGAALDLFYVRANFQKAFEQAESPAIVVLPKRVETGPRDSVTIRALLDGYRQQEVHVRVRARQDKVTIDLEPLANALLALPHTYLAGRGSLSFLTKQALTFRMQEKEGGVAVILLQTAVTPEAAQAISEVKSSFVASLRAQQIGEDLVVSVALTEAARDGRVEFRSRQSFDPVRGLHSFVLDLVPSDRGAAAVARARAALERIQPADVAGCAAVFDSAVREQLEPAALTRALAPRGSFTDPYLRAAMKRLGEVSEGGEISLADGSVYRTSVPMELSAASSQASEVHGYLALLRHSRFSNDRYSVRDRVPTLRTF